VVRQGVQTLACCARATRRRPRARRSARRSGRHHPQGDWQGNIHGAMTFAAPHNASRFRQHRISKRNAKTQVAGCLAAASWRQRHAQLGHGGRPVRTDHAVRRARFQRRRTESPGRDARRGKPTNWLR
jgi:hypothetical protein